MNSKLSDVTALVCCVIASPSLFVILRDGTERRIRDAQDKLRVTISSLRYGIASAQMTPRNDKRGGFSEIRKDDFLLNLLR